jgi:uncharacterized OsmC-like protein
MDRIRDSIQAAINYLTDHPDEARYVDSAATAKIEDGLRVRVDGPSGEQIFTDMPTSVGGAGSAPSPGWLFRASVASCEATLITMRAAMQGVVLSRLDVTVESDSDDRGILDMSESVPSGPLQLRIRVHIASRGASRAQLAEIAYWGDRHCPVADGARRAVSTTFEIAD